MRLVVIVDMINGFINEGAMSDPDSRKLINPIISVIEDAIKHKDMVVAFRDEHLEDSLEFKTYPVHCLKGTAESQLIDELLPYQEKMIDIAKNSTNGFMTKKFQNILSDNKFDEIVLVGVCTDICVLQATLSVITYLYQNQINTDVIIAKDTVSTFDSEQHNREYYQQAALSLLSNASAIIKDSYLELERK